MFLTPGITEPQGYIILYKMAARGKMKVQEKKIIKRGERKKEKIASNTELHLFGV